MIELTDEQWSAVSRAMQPVRLVDRATNRQYVLVPAELYERLQGLLNDHLESDQVAELVESTMREYDGDEPLLDTYQKYRQ
jgi:hypothetical protein